MPIENADARGGGRNPPEVTATRERYLNLLKLCLTRARFLEHYRPLAPLTRPRRIANSLAQWLLATQNLELVRRIDPRSHERELGTDWPAFAETMIGLRRLDNLQECIESVVADDVPGDLIETGVWRGGAVIFSRAVFDAWEAHDRVVWAADSFCGLPSPNVELYPADEADCHHEHAQLCTSLDEVRGNFAKYGLSEDGVRFLVGWFKDTLPSAPIDRLAVLRLDGDMYESTMDALRSLYPKLSVGGYVIVDDYHLHGARLAVSDYRAELGITEPIIDIDGLGAFWRRVR